MSWRIFQRSASLVHVAIVKAPIGCIAFQQNIVVTSTFFLLKGIVIREAEIQRPHFSIEPVLEDPDFSTNLKKNNSTETNQSENEIKQLKKEYSDEIIA